MTNFEKTEVDLIPDSIGEDSKNRNELLEEQ